MPIYVYQEIKENNEDGEIFEIVQSMKDRPLSHHPVTGNPVRKLIQAPNLISKYSDTSIKKRIDNKRIEELGFVKYEKDKLTGRYNKVAGKQGPSMIDPKIALAGDD